MNFNFNSVSLFFFRRCDASSLAFTRIITGILLLIDLVNERGLSRADTIWGDTKECRFPLFDGLPVLPIRGMFAIYSLMLIGNVGIILGLKYKLSCFTYLSCFWYLFLLDKSRWNNHSYLFGLLVSLLSISNANNKWSVDNSLSYESTRETSVPFWQYFLIRTQIFLVYFIAGLKKIDFDWLCGHSMNYLSEHWVFSPFRILLTNESIDYYIIHLGGFLFDLTIGFFFIWDKSRSFAYILCTLFNVMNSRLFSIGMFPYMMIAVMPVFSAHDWPTSLINSFRDKFNKMNRKEIKILKKTKGTEKLTAPTKRQKLTLISILIYLLIQLFLPFSHRFTEGYNTWTNGLYGYSWDMMVHNWRHIHTRVTVVDKSMRKFYLNPEAWTKSWRWSHHSDMVKQYAICAYTRLTNDFNITEPSIYVDSWISLNGRFAQRVYDPRVDIVKAEWNAFRKPKWVLPVLSHLTDWRQTLKDYEQNISEENEYNSVIFIADFPGLSLSNYIGSDFGNTSLIVLKGWLKIQIQGLSTRILSVGDRITVPTKRFHKLTPIRSESAAYMYVYINTTQQLMDKQINPLQEPILSDKVESNPIKGINAWIRSFRNIREGLKAILEMIYKLFLTLFKRFFICCLNE